MTQRDESNPAADHDDDQPDVAGDEPIPVDINKLAELRQARKDRLARIRSEIENGTYESDELLDAALQRMIGRMSAEPDPEESEEEPP